MRKLIVMAVICLTAITAGWFSSCKGKKSEATTSNTEDSVKKVVARGEYLANHVAGCMDCHSKRDLTKFSGPVIEGTEGGGGFAFTEKFGLPGLIYGRNITPDPETGIGNWSDEDILKAMTLGISKNGDTLFPLMPYSSYNRMGKADLLSIIAYLRTLKPIVNKVLPRQLMVPIAAVYPGKFLQPSVDGNPIPAETDKVKYGEYLINFADCGTCHSPLTPHGPDMTRRYAGGYIFDLGTNKVVSANITPDSATGIGSWTEERFLTKFTQYRDKASYDHAGGNQNTIMPLSILAGMKDDDLKAIYAYLRTLKPITNMVEKFPK
jgi:Cytochrome c